ELAERETMQDLFGRYVGEDVVLHALENGTELGGSERTVGVLFVDLAGSTEFAIKHSPNEVVEMLNQFFRIVVETVDEHGGYINKFQGDAALAIFGAPMEAWDPAGQALATARALGRKLASIQPLTAGIGVSYGTVIAGHIGHAKRFEYTVIGDPVNESARLTALAKEVEGGVLAARRAIEAADTEEADRWTFGRAVELRGRGVLTQLARPLRPTLADRWQAARDLGLEELPNITEPTMRAELLTEEDGAGPDAHPHETDANGADTNPAGANVADPSEAGPRR
ncbi:adenylate/guanylate cyclase domain-containing protein, partial [Dietzia sp.]|uniref:adenylate/guanylate cyclase domain-containing protein n=1 Tax=Dietzia sp. TaxID=1871616 RepID=UPI002FDACFC0